MGVVVFDSAVLIGFLRKSDAHHAASVQWMERALAPGNERLLCAVNYSEILVGPLKAGKQDTVDAMLVQFAITTVGVDMDLARRAAAVRVRTGLQLPDAYAVATAIHAEKRGRSNVTLASFDAKVVRAYAELHPTDV